ncbi:MAG: HDOD domain-containing protein [Actinomycetota bacterium]
MLETAPEPVETTDPLCVVFVDSDPNLAASLRLAASSWGDRWDVHLGIDHAHALEILDRVGGAHVVVSDFVLRDSSGIELLDEVRRMYPRTGRIIQASSVHRDSALKAIGTAHRFLPKPCDTSFMLELIDGLDPRITNPLRNPVAAVIGQADQLPSPPAMYVKIRKIMSSEDWELGDVAAAITEDVALTAKIMRMVNSAFFGFPREVDSIELAVSLLGADNLQGIVLGHTLFAYPTRADWVDVRAIADRSVLIASCTRALADAEGENRGTVGQAFLTGMLCEVGVLVLAEIPNMNTYMAEVAMNLNDRDVERGLFGGDCYEVGAALLALWDFDPDVVEAIRHLSHDDAPLATGMGGYLRSARHLVMSEQFPPELADEADVGLPSRPEIEEQLRAAYQSRSVPALEP